MRRPLAGIRFSKLDATQPRGRARLAILALTALALSILANAATARLVPPITAFGAVLIVAEVVGGVALGYAAIAVFGGGRDPSMGGMAVFSRREMRVRRSPGRQVTLAATWSTPRPCRPAWCSAATPPGVC
jgi:hypothetical protein